ncbi:MAG: GyrI-like domain-containing protein [Acidobacteriota bacterium]
MFLRIEEIDERKLVGIKIRTSIAENPNRELWQRFKPLARNIRGRESTDFYSVEVFDAATSFENFTPETQFEKWAAVDVSGLDDVPDEMEALTLSGTYAVFLHTGLPSDFPATSEYIFGEWIPASAYVVDQRPHFEIMAADYLPDDAEATEEIYVPIKPKAAI